MVAIKTFYLAKKRVNSSYIMGGVFLVAGFVFTAMTQNFALMPFFFGFLVLTMGYFNSKLKVVQLFEKHFEIQAGLGASKKLITYENLNKVEESSKNVVLLYDDEEGKPKKAKIFKQSLEAEDLKGFLSHLKTNQPQKVTV